MRQTPVNPVFGYVEGSSEEARLMATHLSEPQIRAALRNRAWARNSTALPQPDLTPRRRVKAATAPSPRAEALPIVPSWDPFSYVPKWSGRLTKTAVAVIRSLDMVTETRLENLGYEMGALWRRPHVLAEALGLEVFSASRGALQRSGSDGKLILARLMPPPFFRPAIAVIQTTYQEEEQLVAHELAHWCFPGINDGTEQAEALADAFSKGWHLPSPGPG